MTLAKEIRTRRKALKLTQVELAEMIGVGQGRLGEYERGDREPTITTLRALAEVLGPFTIGAEMKNAKDIQNALDEIDVHALSKALDAALDFSIEHAEVNEETVLLVGDYEVSVSTEDGWEWRRVFEDGVPIDIDRSRVAEDGFEDVDEFEALLLEAGYLSE